MKARTLVQRLVDAWRLLLCEGYAQRIERATPAAYLETAGRVDVGAEQALWSHMWVCLQINHGCKACPRFQAYRQGLLAACEDGTRNLQMTPCRVDLIKPDVRDSDGKAAEVANIDQQQMIVARSIHTCRDVDLDAHPIALPSAPEIQHAQHCAHGSQRRGDVLQRIGGHAGNVAQQGRARTTLLNWLCAAALGFALAASHHLDREHAEHGWAADSATVLREAQIVAAREHRRELRAQRMCGNEHATPMWIDEHTVRCATKGGYITRTVHQVSTP